MRRSDFTSNSRSMRKHRRMSCCPLSLSFQPLQPRVAFAVAHTVACAMSVEDKNKGPGAPLERGFQAQNEKGNPDAYENGHKPAPHTGTLFATGSTWARGFNVYIFVLSRTAHDAAITPSGIREYVCPVRSLARFTAWVWCILFVSIRQGLRGLLSS